MKHGGEYLLGYEYRIDCYVTILRVYGTCKINVSRLGIFFLNFLSRIVPLSLVLRSIYFTYYTTDIYIYIYVCIYLYSNEMQF